MHILPCAIELHTIIEHVKLHTQTISLLLSKNVVFLYFDLQIGESDYPLANTKNNISEGKVLKSRQVFKFNHLVTGYH
jgi:hypothetical protein